MEILAKFLFLFNLGISILSCLISLSLWLSYRNYNYKLIFLLWINMIIYLIACILSVKLGFSLSLEVIFNFTVVGLTLLPMVFKIVYIIHSVKLSSYYYYRFFFIMQIIALTLYFLKFPYLAIGLVSVCASVFPVSYYLWKLRYGSLNIKHSALSKGFIFILFIQLLHMIDYPFVRPLAKSYPIVIIIGYTIAFLGTFAMAIFLPALITEKMQEKYSIQLEKEVKKRTQELKRTQVQLIQSEKMAGIGQLAAGVAHEINNPLGYIINNFYVLKKYINNIFQFFSEYDQIVKKVQNLIHDKKKIKVLNDQLLNKKKEVRLEYIKNDLTDIIDENLEGVERVKHIVNDLKNFAYPLQDKFKYTNINKEIEKALDILMNKVSYNVEIKKELKKIPDVYCNLEQINQVFVNLLINAVQASAKNKSYIQIKSYSNSSFVIIEIKDQGDGIAKKYINKIFDPFFTTKEVGEATGLGLSIVYNIIKYHNGNIKVNSTLGRGTTFIIKLPIKRI